MFFLSGAGHSSEETEVDLVKSAFKYSTASSSEGFVMFDMCQFWHFIHWQYLNWNVYAANILRLKKIKSLFPSWKNPHECVKQVKTMNTALLDYSWKMELTASRSPMYFVCIANHLTGNDRASYYASMTSIKYLWFHLTVQISCNLGVDFCAIITIALRYDRQWIRAVPKSGNKLNIYRTDKILGPIGCHWISLCLRLDIFLPSSKWHSDPFFLCLSSRYMGICGFQLS